MQDEGDLREGGRDLTRRVHNWVNCTGLANCQAHSRWGPDIYQMIISFMCVIEKTFQVGRLILNGGSPERTFRAQVLLGK